MLWLLRISCALSFLCASNSAFAYVVGKAKIVECATNHEGSCVLLVSKEFVNRKNLVTSDMTVYYGNQAVYSVKKIISVRKLDLRGQLFEIQTIGRWEIPPANRKRMLKSKPVLRFIKLFKKSPRPLWVFRMKTSDADLLI